MSGQPDGPTDDDAIKGYEWTCPFCGRSQLKPSTGEGERQYAVAALRTHILASDGGGHGSRGSLPDDGPGDLSEHVRAVTE